MRRSRRSSINGWARTSISAATIRGRKRWRMRASSLSPDKLLENIASGTRPQAVNINFGYAVPGATKYWNNKFTELVTNDWHIEGILTFYYGTPLSIGCSANGAPIGYWTGTPTGGVPFRCEQNGPLFNSSQTPTAASPLWYDFNVSAFSLPPVNSLGIGNEQPTVTYGPGVENTDFSLFKQFHVWDEHKTAGIPDSGVQRSEPLQPEQPEYFARHSIAAR